MRFAEQTVTLPPINEGEGSRSIKIRPLWARETDAIDDVYPRPVAPMGKNPNAGSLAPPIPNEADPGYQRDLRRWLKNLKRAQVALAMRQTQAWSEKEITEATEAVANTYTADEIELLWIRLREMSTGEMIRQALTVIVTGNAEAEATEPDERTKIPESYAITEVGLMMRAAERFGQNPATWPATLSPEERGKVIAHELVRRREENEKMDAIRAALGVLGV